MTIIRYPGNLRVGVMHLPVHGVQTPGPQAIDPKQMLLILLNGHQRFRIDQREFVFSTRDGPQALLLRIEQPSELEFLENQGEPLSKIAVIADLDWLEAVQPGSPAGAGLAGHLSARMWRPDARMVALATELIQSADLMRDFEDELTEHCTSGADALRLFRMSRGIELLHRALVAAPGVMDLPAPEPGHPKIEQLRRYVADHLSDPDLGPDQLARGCGIGLRSLQRLCRDFLGCSPGDFIRHQRFEAAFEALRRGAANVSQAAFLAGYSNAANFSTAFKREYGVAPKFIRRDLRGGS